MCTFRRTRKNKRKESREIYVKYNSQELFERIKGPRIKARLPGEHRVYDRADGDEQQSDRVWFVIRGCRPRGCRSIFR